MTNSLKLYWLHNLGLFHLHQPQSKHISCSIWATIFFHHFVSLFCSTIFFHHFVSLFCSTILFHHFCSPCCSTILFLYFVLPFCPNKLFLRLLNHSHSMVYNDILLFVFYSCVSLLVNLYFNLVYSVQFLFVLIWI